MRSKNTLLLSARTFILSIWTQFACQIEIRQDVQYYSYRIHMPVPRLCSNHYEYAFPVQIEISKSRKKNKKSNPKNTPPGDALPQPVNCTLDELKTYKQTRTLKLKIRNKKIKLLQYHTRIRTRTVKGKSTPQSTPVRYTRTGT